MNPYEQQAVDAIVQRHGITTKREAIADLRDAVMAAYDAREPWAVEFVGQAVWARCQNVLKQNVQAQSRVTVLAAGAVTDHPAAIGVRRADQSGALHYQQEMIWTATYDEIRDWMELQRRQAKASGANVDMAAKLLLLEKKVPGSLTPADAAQKLGTTVADYLAS